MIQSSPKPLPRQRLEKLIAGLKVRTSSSAKQMALELQQLQDDIGQLESQYESDARHLAASHRQGIEQTTTDWDEQLSSCWDAAESKTYQAIFETRNRERSLIATAKSDTEQVNAEAKKRVNEIEKRCAHAIEVTGHKLEQFWAQIDAVKRVVEKVDLDAEAALAKHSLRVAATPDNLSPAEVRDAQHALELSKHAVIAAQQHVRKLENLPMSNLSKSPMWWLVCFAVLAGGIAIPWLVGQPPLVAIPIGVGALVLAILTAMLGVRPWLKKGAAAEFPKLKSQLQLANNYLQISHENSVKENDAEQKRLAAKRDDRLNRVTTWHETQISEIKHKAESAILALRAKAQAERNQAADKLRSGLDQTNRQFEADLAAAEQKARERAQLAESRLATNRAAMLAQIEQLKAGGAHRLVVSTRKASEYLVRNNDWCELHFPNWSRFAEGGFWPVPLEQPTFPIGQVTVGKSDVVDTGAMQNPLCVDTTVLFAPLQDSYLVIHADPNRAEVKDYLRNLILRGLTTLVAGKTNVCVIDPPGLGRDFGWLMNLSDFDPALVTHRVWTQPTHITRQLQEMASSAEDFIQQSLRNQYASIVDYNRDAGSLAEPFRLLVWTAIPSGLDDQSWKSLQSLLDTGARCGIIPILIVDPARQVPKEYADIINRRGLHLSLLDNGELAVRTNLDSELHVHAPTPVSDGDADQIIREVGRRALAASRVEVPLSKIVGTGSSERWQGDSSRSLEIPIGQSGVGRVHSMKLGVGTAQHAIIAGKTGSGKSSLLHALITSALMKYSPERLRLVLLDFKKGVEFQVYSDSEIPHADIIGIESHREFGLSALEYVDDCLQRRGELFRKAGVQDIASWNAVSPQTPLPRMLVVIDEFQELFVEDDKLSQAASLILDRIVRQGRSFGVHAVLSSQTLAGSYSLPRTTLGQMAVRIALQCDPSDAQIIFADDNPAATRLKHPGQAVYNDAGGRIEGNQPMQIGWLDKATQQAWFAGFEHGYHNLDVTTNRLGHTVVYDGNRPATWVSAQADMAVSRAQRELNPEAVWCVAGESVSISPAVCFPLTNQAGRNILIVGGEDVMAASVLQITTASFVKSFVDKGHSPRLVCIQGAKPTDARALTLPQLWAQLPVEFSSYDLRTTDEGIASVHRLLQSRLSGEDGSTYPVLVNIIQLGRLRSLRREEEFSFSQTEITADKMLEEILRDGPSHSIYVMVWAESYSTVNRWISRGAMREFEIRLLMQMSANDSSNLVDSTAASKLGDHVMLLSDEATGQQQKFRPYAFDGLAALPSWIGKSKAETPPRLADDAGRATPDGT